MVIAIKHKEQTRGLRAVVRQCHIKFVLRIALVLCESEIAVEIISSCDGSF